MRGYFIGLQEAKVPAINQVLEQIVRMVVVYLLAARFVPRGLEYAAAVAVIAIVAEEIFSCVFVFISYRVFKRKRRLNKKPTLTSRQVFGLIMGMALPLTGNRVTGSLLTAWENVLIPARLQLYGMSASDAISEFGRITGMAVPLIFFPTAVLTALSVTLVPAVAEAAAAGNMRRISTATSKGLLFASVTGMGAAALFVFFSHELGMAIYNQPIGLMLQLLGIMAPFIYMQIILSGVLNGLGCQLFIFRNSIISSGITIAATFFFVPRFGLPAYIFGWLLSLVVIIALGLKRIRRHIDFELKFSNWLVKPVLAAALAGVLARVFANQLFMDALGLRPGLAVTIGLMMLVYLWGIMLSGCITKEEVQGLFKARSNQ